MMTRTRSRSGYSRAVSFNIFLRDNKSKLTTCYPFLSQDQILSRIRQQWRKLNNSDHQVSQSKQNKTSRKSQTDQGRDIALHKTFYSKSHTSSSEIYDSVGRFKWDEDPTSEYARTDKNVNPYSVNHASGTLNNILQPTFLDSNSKGIRERETGTKNKAQRHKQNNLGNKSSSLKPGDSRGVYHRHNLQWKLDSATCTSRPRSITKWERKDKRKTVQAKVHFADYGNRLKDTFEFLELDEEHMQKKDMREKTAGCQSKLTKENFLVRNSSPPFPKGLESQDRLHGKKLYSHQAHDRSLEARNDKNQAEKPLTQKDGTPVRFSKRLRKWDVKSTGLAESSSLMFTDSTKQVSNLDEFSQDKHRFKFAAIESQFQSSLTTLPSCQTLSHRNKRDFSQNVRASGSPNITYISKAKQRQRILRTDDVEKRVKVNKLRCGKLAEVENLIERTSHEPKSTLLSRAKSEKLKERGKAMPSAEVAHVTSTDTMWMDDLDTYEPRTIGDKDALEGNELIEEDSGNVYATAITDHCICSDDEDGDLLLRRYPPFYYENVKDSSNEVVADALPTQQDDHASEKSFSFTYSNSKKHPQLAPEQPEKICSQQKKTLNSIRSIPTKQKEYQFSNEQQCFMENGTCTSHFVRKFLAKDNWTERHQSLDDIQSANESTTSPMENIRHTVSKSLSKSTSKPHREHSQVDKSYNKGNEKFDEEKKDCKKEDEESSVFCSHFASETSTVFLQALMKLKAARSSPEINLSAGDPQTSPESIFSQQSQSSKMHPSFEEVVPKRTTRKRFKNGDCEWSFPDEVETFSCQDSDNDCDSSLSKEPLGVMFQDPTINGPVITPKKRRLVTSAVAATPSNFGSMFDSMDIFL